MHRSVSQRCTIQVITSKDASNDTSRFCTLLVRIQLYRGITTHIGSKVKRTLTTTEDITISRSRSDDTTRQDDLGTLRNTATLTATIDVAFNDTTRDVHIRPNIGSEHIRVILVSSRSSTISNAPSERS